LAADTPGAPSATDDAVIVVSPPAGPVMAHLGDPAKPMPVIGDVPVAAGFVLPRGVFQVTARLRFNGKTEKFEDYLDMPVSLELAGLPMSAKVIGTVRELARTGTLAIQVENGEGSVKVTAQCVEWIGVPWGTPEARAEAFVSRMNSVKARMKWVAEGRDFPSLENPVEASEMAKEMLELLDRATKRSEPVNAATAKYPMLLLEGITVELVRKLPEKRAADPYTITVAAPHLLPEGPGRFSATVNVARAASAAPSALTLLATLTSKHGRIVWQHEAPLVFEGAKAAVALHVVHPDLPPGQYLLNCSLKDATGKMLADLPDVLDAITEYFSPGAMARAYKSLPTAAVRRPISRMQSYMELARELTWGIWENSPGDGNGPGFVEIGFNTGGFQYPYRWQVSFDDWGSGYGWPEYDPVAAAKRTVGAGPLDPGFMVIDTWDERSLSSLTDVEALRYTMLRYARTPRGWPWPMPTIAEYNRRSGNDFLSWDEVERGGFPGHGQAQASINGLDQALVYDNISGRIEAGRLANPYLNHSTGMGAGCDQHFFDSMHNRIYGHSSTVEEFGHFLQAFPRYGLRYWTYLVNVDTDKEEHFKRILWIAVAMNGRFMPFFELGPTLTNEGDGPQKGELTPQGQWARETIARLQPLSPVLMSVRNSLNPDVLFWDPAYYMPFDGVVEGLLANGVQPEVNDTIGARALRANGVQQEAGRKLIILHGSSIGGQDFTPVRRAVEAGACLFMTAEVDNGANGPKAFGLTLTGLPDLVLDEGSTSLPENFRMRVTSEAKKPMQDLDLTPLGEFVPGFKGLICRAVPGPLGELAADSPLKRILAKDRTTLGYAGQVGKGKVVILNAHLLQRWGNRPAHGALMGAVLKWAGVQGALRCTEPGSDRISDQALAIELATQDQTQSYAIVVPEIKANLAFRPADPAVQAVRDLCAGTTLPWKQDAQGRYVEVKLEAGTGTLLSLVKSDPAAPFAITPAVLGAPIPAKQVSGGQTLYLSVSRQAAGAAIADAHTFLVSAKGPDGQVIPGFTEWGTGPGPVVIKLPVAVNEPDGTWTIEVRDMTDGAVGTATIEKLKGFQAEKTEAGAEALEAALGVKPPSYVLEMESVPYLLGDVIIATVRGKLRSAVEGEQDALVSLGIPAEYLLSGTNRIPLRVKSGQATPFEATFCMHRDQFLTVYNGMDYGKDGVQAGLARRVAHEGIRVRAEIAGKTVAQAKWVTDLNRWLRKPAGRIGSVSGGDYAFLVENLSGKECRVELACEGRPGWAGGQWNVSRAVPAGQRVEVRQKVTWADSTRADPGYHWLPLAVKVDGRTFDGQTVFVEEAFEQPWWILNHSVKFAAGPGESDVEQWLPELAAAPVKLPPDPKQAAAAGWQRLDTEGVIWGAALVNTLKPPAAGSILAGAYVNAPTARGVKVGFVGSKPPKRIWVNDQLVDGAWGAMKGGGVSAKPTAFKKGLNVVILEIELPLKLYRPPPSPFTVGGYLDDGLAVMLQDPKTGKRDRDLVVEAR
jgi:hypothetical protein